jgi:hypothetical protein
MLGIIIQLVLVKEKVIEIPVGYSIVKISDEKYIIC